MVIVKNEIKPFSLDIIVIENMWCGLADHFDLVNISSPCKAREGFCAHARFNVGNKKVKPGEKEKNKKIINSSMTAVCLMWTAAS